VFKIDRLVKKLRRWIVEDAIQSLSSQAQWWTSAW